MRHGDSNVTASNLRVTAAKQVKLNQLLNNITGGASGTNELKAINITVSDQNGKQTD